MSADDLKAHALDTVIAADQALEQADAALEQADRRVQERRSTGRPRTGRRSIDRPANAWSTGQMAFHVGMTSWFIVREIEAGELKASRIGREYRIHVAEVRRYLEAKGFPLPEWMTAA